MKRSSSAVVASAIGAVLGLTGFVTAAYEITWSTIDGGGGTSTGGGYELTGTIGQPDATAPGALTGGTISVTGGFWVQFPLTCSSYSPFDFDHDCDVDSADLATFLTCVSGPNLPDNGTPLCTGVDIDHDGDVDQLDYAKFQICFSGPNLLADPLCAN